MILNFVIFVKFWDIYVTLSFLVIFFICCDFWDLWFYSVVDFCDCCNFYMVFSKFLEIFTNGMVLNDWDCVVFCFGLLLLHRQ